MNPKILANSALELLTKFLFKKNFGVIVFLIDILDKRIFEVLTKIDDRLIRSKYSGLIITTRNSSGIEISYKHGMGLCAGKYLKDRSKDYLVFLDPDQICCGGSGNIRCNAEITDILCNKFKNCADVKKFLAASFIQKNWRICRKKRAKNLLNCLIYLKNKYFCSPYDVPVEILCEIGKYFV